ncbi:MAG: CaiB/BaiF CoA-transferase family protein [Vicinamibacterales bacterium]|nr:CaiB/BaiF CoA-transferase family protein [Vicinamibacterales bacterium]
MRPLDGLTVLSLEQAVAAPFATRQLADLGARVIKIERPGVGDFARGYDATVKGESSHFVWLNRSKESLTLDVKRPGAAEVLRRLLDRADIFVQNLAPGATGRLGLGAGSLREAHPRLVVCEISGYGSTGPYRDRKAYDLLVQAEAGLLSITGTPEEQVKVGISVADIAAGMYAYSGILTALLLRHRTGTGTVVEISMLEALSEWMGYPLYYGVYGGTPPQRSGARHAVIAPYGPFAGGDGEVVYLGIQNEREWQAFCTGVLAQPGLATDPRFVSNADRVAHRDALDVEIEAVFSRMTTPEILDRLESARIANARLRTVQQLADHPQLAARERWRDIETPAGVIRATLPPASIDGVVPAMDPVPALGDHTDAILDELGFDAATVAAWHDDGTV